MAARKTNSRKKSSKAAGPKKSTGTRSRKKNTVQRASASSKRQAKKPVESAGIAGDVILLVALVSAILIFAFNFHPWKSFEGYPIVTGDTGDYKVVMSTDETRFGGSGRVDMNYVYTAKEIDEERKGFLCYVPSRSAIVFKKK